jgi:hypothetical protein
VPFFITFLMVASRLLSPLMWQEEEYISTVSDM